MVVLGDVREIQEVGEGTCERCRRFNREFRKQRRELADIRTRCLGQHPNALDGLEELGPAVRSERFAEKFSQQPDVTT